MLREDLKFFFPLVCLRSLVSFLPLLSDILHPEMVEAIDSLQQLDYEESELVKQLRRLVITAGSQGRCPDRNFVEALCMELDLRRREKIRTIETFRRVEDERCERL